MKKKQDRWATVETPRNYVFILNATTTHIFQKNVTRTQTKVTTSHTQKSVNAAHISKNVMEGNTCKKVILWTYFRSGSSFFGELFQNNPAAFYLFEPLDGLYGSMFANGWHWSPQNIFWNQDGSSRYVLINVVVSSSAFSISYECLTNHKLKCRLLISEIY